MIMNILIGFIVIGITVTIQGYGTAFWLDYIFKNYYQLPNPIFEKKSIKLLISTALFLLLMNFVEAGIWAFTYLLLPNITEFETIEKSIYFSLVTFTTLGYGDITISTSNRILAGFEAMNGILLIGWSTTLMFSVVQNILRKNATHLVKFTEKS